MTTKTTKTYEIKGIEYRRGALADDYELRDSNTNETVSVDDVGNIDDYEGAIYESLTCGQTEGHVRVNGRRVYAQ